MENENKLPDQTQQRLARIKEYEEKGGEAYFLDVDDNPPTKTLMPNDVDYLKKKLSSKFRNLISRRIIRKMLTNFAKTHNIKVEGIENLKNLKTGAVITTNHFHYFDSAPLVYTFKQEKIKKKMHIVIREGNYQIPGLFGYLLKNYYTFPLSSNMKTTINLNHAIDTVLKKKEFVLVYPEQAMWWKYRKPRLYRIGAYRWAVRNNVPILPCFVTMEDGETIEEDGLAAQNLTLHIGKPLYADKELPLKEAAEKLLAENHDFCVDVYEKTYNLKYEINE